MNDKQITQVEEMLEGRQYKLLDPRRRTVLALPPNAFKLWMAYWMFESDEQEAYPSLDTLERVMQTGRQAILRAREYLLKTGWLVKLTGTAAERYVKPTRGAHNVAVYRVDDPTKGVKITLPEKGVIDTPQKITPKVSSSVSASSYEYGYNSHCKYSEASPLDGKTEKPKTTPARSTQGGTRPRSAQSETSRAKWLATYDSPKPVDFDSWSQPARTSWCEEHRLGKKSQSKSPAQFQPVADEIDELDPYEPPCRPLTREWSRPPANGHIVFDPNCLDCFAADAPCAVK